MKSERTNKPDTRVEVSWFAPICNGDDKYLGYHDDKYKSNWKNASKIVKTADKLGFNNILCPSSYQVGQDTLTFAAAVAPSLKNISLLPAIRCGEIHPPTLAKSISTLDNILKGRLTLNMISSNLPGTQLDSKKRYRRSRELIQILKEFWNNDFLNFKGEFYNLNLPSDPVKTYQTGGPLMYFGGYSDDGLNLCAEFCDVYLMWPEKKESIKNLINEMKIKAKSFKRTVNFGLRVHVIVRETENEAREYAKKIISKLDIIKGEEIKNRALDARSLGVSRQSQMIKESDKDYFVEDSLWTGIGLARSGCGAAIVGDPDQVLKKLKSYIKMGIKSFILSGYPNLKESILFAKYILPKLDTVSFPELFKKLPEIEPSTPLCREKRK